MHNDSFNADLQEVMRRLASAQPGNRQRSTHEPLNEPSGLRNSQPASRVEPKTHPQAATDT
ncbi:MAG TPA: hypothetical protein VK819_04950 [Acidobacteriaceae bacterium]|jgi:hypothetical protein|nr:hypothetical protein [Acidobacteriaceae bacterium]